jgi:hypothetical protein
MYLNWTSDIRAGWWLNLGFDSDIPMRLLRWRALSKFCPIPKSGAALTSENSVLSNPEKPKPVHDTPNGKKRKPTSSPGSQRPLPIAMPQGPA